MTPVIPRHDLEFASEVTHKIGPEEVIAGKPIATDERDRSLSDRSEVDLCPIKALSGSLLLGREAKEF